MATERFSKAEFEKALAGTGYTFGSGAIMGGEYRFYSTIRKGLLLAVNSSISSTGFADGTGENSIRIWVCDENGKPLAGKTQAYVTRVAGWQVRLNKVVRETVESVKELVDSPSCPKCGGLMVQRKSARGEFWGCKKYPTCTGTKNIVKEYTGARLGAKPVAATKPVAEVVVAETIVAAPVASKKFQPSKYQAAIFAWIMGTGKNLMVEAIAGSGKTTTGVEMLNLVPADKKVLFVAFNKTIATELSKRAPAHVKCSTYHSLGYAAIRAAFGNVVVDDDNKVFDMIKRVMDVKENRHMISPIKTLVSLVKANLSGTTTQELDAICDHHGIETNGDRETIFQAVQQVVELCKTTTNRIDFDDMCWFPVVHNLSCEKYDVLFIDEAQDTNKNQIALALMSIKDDGRIIAVGDRHQSLYGFRGADVNSIPNLIENLQADVLPLSITYRCPKAVVALVNSKFPEISFECSPSAKDGIVRETSEEKALVEYKAGDMVLCRTNAPLVAPAFELIKHGIKAVIRGRDISSNLLSMVKKMDANSIVELLSKLAAYKEREVEKLSAANKSTQAQALTDKVETLVALSSGVETVYELESRITTIFSDKVEGVVFSTVHKAKGLEANTVFILHPELLPHPMAKKDWEKQQEANIEYVAYTRSLNELVIVNTTTNK